MLGKRCVIYCRPRIILTPHFLVWRRVHVCPARTSYYRCAGPQGQQFYPWRKVNGFECRRCLYREYQAFPPEIPIHLSPTQHLTTPIFGKGVVYDVPNEVFMEQKRFVKVGLSTDNFRTYVGMIEEEVEDFLKTDPAFSVFQANDINEWGSFDVAKALQEITILTASRTLQGKEVRENLDKSFSGLYNDLDGGFTPLNFMFPNLPLASYRRRDRAHIKMSEFYVDIIKKRRAGGDVSNTCIFLNSWY